MLPYNQLQTQLEQLFSPPSTYPQLPRWSRAKPTGPRYTWISIIYSPASNAGYQVTRVTGTLLLTHVYPAEVTPREALTYLVSAYGRLDSAYLGSLQLGKSSVNQIDSDRVELSLPFTYHYGE